VVEKTFEGWGFLEQPRNKIRQGSGDSAHAQGQERGSLEEVEQNDPHEHKAISFSGLCG